MAVCREQGELSPPHTMDVWMLRSREEGEFSPPRAADVKIERGGGENPLLTPWMSRSRGEGRVLPSSRHGCVKNPLRHIET